MSNKLYFEDLKVGDCWTTPLRAIVPQDVSTFADLTGDWNPLHWDESYATQTPYRRPIAHGLLGLGLVAGLGSMHPELHEVVLTRLIDWRFCEPLFPGDQVRVINEVMELEARGKRRSLVVWRRRLLNQRGHLIQVGMFETLVARRGSQQVRERAASSVAQPVATDMGPERQQRLTVA